ncbi:MAG: GNAT family N-acetyltransferase [Flavobacteriales bacterium]|nr:GNAT family N-acetyltransferase [Flavobacteriales bacterium]
MEFVQIRKAGKEDLSLLCRLGRQTFIEAYAAQNDPQNMERYLAENFTDETTLAELHTADSDFFILEYKSEPVGYARTRNAEIVHQLEDRRYAELARLYMLDTHHRLGLGRHLLQHCIDFLGSAGYNTVWLGVWKKNEKAIAFYEAFGFRIFGEHIFPFGNENQSDWIMRYDITQR